MSTETITCLKCGKEGTLDEFTPSPKVDNRIVCPVCKKWTRAPEEEPLAAVIKRINKELQHEKVLDSDLNLLRAASGKPTHIPNSPHSGRDRDSPSSE